jgi:hypothetical protein
VKKERRPPRKRTPPITIRNTGQKSPAMIVGRKGNSSMHVPNETVIHPMMESSLHHYKSSLASLAVLLPKMPWHNFKK